MSLDLSVAENQGLAIAIVGLSGRFPGARDVTQLWQNLRAGRSSIVQLGTEQLLASGVPREQLEDPRYVRAAAVIEEAERFDAPFFGISATEARLLDPQHRILLETAWEALEDAGHAPARFPGLIGIFAGSRMSEHVGRVLRHRGSLGSVSDLQILLANDKDHLVTRVAYKLGLEGPAVAVQTACSTSLVAVHLACQSLLAGDCDLALAGGVAIRSPQLTGYLSPEAEIFSPDGLTRSFDAASAGTLFGNGVGLVVLRRLSEAIADGDFIRAVIRGSAINNDGRAKVAYTAPRPEGQSQVIRAALAMMRTDPASIDYLEAHGTATSLGDPIEVTALNRVFGQTDRPAGSLLIGSIKSNFGHLETAAGIAGLIKTVLALQHGELPPSLHFRAPNPAIDFAGGPVEVNTRLRPWSRRPGGPRRAGVSSFGMGGTNAHVVLEEAPAVPRERPADGPQLLVLSARTRTSLEQARTRLAEHLERHPELTLAEVSSTLQRGRTAFPYRWSSACSEPGAALAALRSKAGDSQPAQEESAPTVAFLFPGQGSPFPAFAAGLYARERAFQHSLDRCLGALPRPLGSELRQLLLLEPASSARERWRETRLAQPGLFAVEIALVELWRSWGIEPEALLGHSLGELVAACVAGTFELEEALALVAERGRLMGSLPPGAMAAVSLPESELLPRLSADLALAAINAPDRLVVTGPIAAVESLLGDLARAGLAAQRLATHHAFHSSAVEAILPELGARLSRMRLSPPRVPFVSNLSGDWIRTDEALDPSYWLRQLRQPVQFARGLDRLLSESRHALLEMGPGRMLVGLAPRLGSWQATRLALASSAADGASSTLHATLGRLWERGVEVDWEGLQGETRPRRVPLPTYPFEREDFRLATETPRQVGEAPAQASIELGPAQLYQATWHQLAPAGPPESPQPERERWLLFEAGEDPLAQAFADALGQRGASLRRLRGDADRAELVAVLTGELAAAPSALRLVHMPSQSGTAGFRHLVALVQALADVSASARTRIRLEVVTESLWSIGAEPAAAPEDVLRLAIVRVAPAEQAGITAHLVDLDPVTARSVSGPTVLLRELAQAARPREVALRGERRFERRYTPHRAEHRQPLGTLRPGGTYWITGGLGGIGLALAKDLARRLGARLLLTGRQASAERAEAVERALVELGGQALVLAADVTDEAAMAAALRQARQRFGAIEGVFHAAGVPSGALLARRTPAEIDAVLAPKVRGTEVLARVLAAEPPALVVLMSSALAATGLAGQTDYTAANLFLESWAEQRATAGGQRVVAIAWDLWRETGMAVSTAASGGAAPLVTSSLEGSTLSAGPEAGPWALHPEPDPQGPQRSLFRLELAAEDHWLLAEHAIGGAPVLPAVALIAITAACYEQLTGERRLEIHHLVFSQPLLFGPRERREVEVLLQQRAERWLVSVRSRTLGSSTWQEHAQAEIERLGDLRPSADDEPLLSGLSGSSLGALLSPKRLSPPTSGVTWGSSWQAVTARSLGPDRIELELAEPHRDRLAQWLLYPPLLDWALSAAALELGGAYLPFSCERVTILDALPAKVFVHHRLLQGGEPDAPQRSFDLRVQGADGRERVRFEGFCLRRLAPSTAPDRSDLGRHLAVGLSTAGALIALQEVLEHTRLSHVLVSARGPEETLSLLTRRADSSSSAASPEVAAPGPSREVVTGLPRRPDLRTAFEAPRDGLEQIVAEVWQTCLGFEGIGVFDDFFELGGDSIQAIQVLAGLRESLGVALPAGTLFSIPTVAGLATELAERLAQDLEAAGLDASSYPASEEPRSRETP